MATLVLAAAGAAFGASFGGGTILGLTGAVLGRAAGATIGQVIDQRMLASGSEPVRTGKVDRFRIMGAAEGAPIPRVWGRNRIAGQVIWASRFKERIVEKEGGGKGAPSTPDIEMYRYSVSLAVALCEGPILRVGRIWADGHEIDPSAYDMRVYLGDEAQLPDPKIAATEGLDRTPAFRGTAYVVFENLPLGPFGNRVPQFNFEVVRGAKVSQDTEGRTLGTRLSAVSIIPGTGEYTLAHQVVREARRAGRGKALNRNAGQRRPDFAVSQAQLLREMPHLKSASLVVSWFGDDLRCNQCKIRPKVETRTDGAELPWRSGGLNRDQAQILPAIDGQRIYGGTPADAAVVQAITSLRQAGKLVMFYPFVLMEQMSGNGRPDPWHPETEQPTLPWRGRITLSKAPGVDGTTDRTEIAEQEVDAFMGLATVADVTIQNGNVVHTGIEDWGYRRFILHYARLCQLAGGVSAFCIGSELRGLTQIRGANDAFPFVQQLKQLAADVRAILGPETKIGYAADWSEYSGYSADGNRYFHLDPLWGDENIDFIGIDNYMPLADWRDGENHTDAKYGSTYDLEYLKSNVQGGEGYDWYYDSVEGVTAQRRVPIIDDQGEPWIWRYKDIRSWWSEPHFDRINGVRSEISTAWSPASKPIWFTEFGCAAIDKAANQPNLFLDAKSSESALPRFSGGARDDLIQMQYYLALLEYWSDGSNNPISGVYGGRMIDLDRCHAWAWDVRPYPAFPARRGLWSDAPNYARGHWLNGRTSSVALRDVVDEILDRAGAKYCDTSRLYGLVRGFVDDGAESARAALQPLMIANDFDCYERDGVLHFRNRSACVRHVIDVASVVMRDDGDIQHLRAGSSELPQEIRLNHVESEGNYEAKLTAASLPNTAGSPTVSDAELPVVLTEKEARTIADRMLTQVHMSQESVRFGLPKSYLAVGAGDLVELGRQVLRVDRVSEGEFLEIEAETTMNLPQLGSEGEDAPSRIEFGPDDSGFLPLFLDLPLLTGDEQPQAPYIAVGAEQWPGQLGVWHSASQSGFQLNTLVGTPTIMGELETPIVAARPGILDHSAAMRVRLVAGELSSVEVGALLNGANMAAIGSGATRDWEVFQFAEAVPISPDVWQLKTLLRGQCGTDGVMPPVWPAGSQVVFLNYGCQQLQLRHAELGLARNYRVGVANLGYDDENVVAIEAAFEGVGLRPYRVCHLRVARLESEDRFTWIRRTRVNGDPWSTGETPLGEAAERYVLRVVKNGQVLREDAVTSSVWSYPQTTRVQDGAGQNYVLQVAQWSEQFGAGPFRSIDV